MMMKIFLTISILMIASILSFSLLLPIMVRMGRKYQYLEMKWEKKEAKALKKLLKKSKKKKKKKKK